MVSRHVIDYFASNGAAARLTLIGKDYRLALLVAHVGYSL